MLASLLAALTLAAPADSILLRVLAMTDFHGALLPRVYRWSDQRPVGGIAALKGYMDSLEAECACPVLRLDAGDEMQGTLESNLVYGRSAIEALNLLGLDGAAVGNHDLDWTVDSLGARMREARYPWLVANVFDSATGRRPDWARPYRIVTAGRYRVGLVGYLTPTSKKIVLADNVAGLRFGRGRVAIEDALAAVHEAGVDLTILLAHEGAFCDSTCHGEIVDLARELDPTSVQLIVAGHTHSLVNTVVNGIPIVIARANSTALGVADLVAGAGAAPSWRVRIETVYADRVRPDSAALALVERYRPEVEQLSRQVVATLGDSLIVGRGEFPLGDLIADAQRAAAHADFALMNNGGIRRDLLPGPVTYGDLFELQPFANFVVSVEVTGGELRDLIEHALIRGTPWAHVSGLVVRYDPRSPAGHRVLALTRTDGRPVEPGARYRLALTNYLAAGGDDYPHLPSLRARRTGFTDLDALVAWLRKGPEPVRAPAVGRMVPVAP